MNNNYNSLLKLASAPTPSVNPATGGTRIPFERGIPNFVGGPDPYKVKNLQRYGLPMTPASSGVSNPSSLSDAETQLRKIQNAEKRNQEGKERNRQNLDAYFARLTALNNANKAAGRPAYNMTALDLYAPFANKANPDSRGDAYHRVQKDQLLNSVAYAAAAKGTPYNPAELNSLRLSIPYNSKLRQVRTDDADYYNLGNEDRWKYVNFGINALRPYLHSLKSNYNASLPWSSLSDYSKKEEED